MKHRTHSTLAQRIPVPPRGGRAGRIVAALLLAAFLASLCVLMLSPSARADDALSQPVTTTQTTGHTPVTVCHNRVHNPVVIVVDANSTQLRGHLKHREQAQLRDLVEGYDGTAEQIVALCVKPDPTTPPVTTSSTTSSSSSSSTTSSSTTTAPPTIGLASFTEQCKQGHSVVLATFYDTTLDETVTARFTTTRNHAKPVVETLTDHPNVSIEHTYDVADGDTLTVSVEQRVGGAWFDVASYTHRAAQCATDTPTTTSSTSSSTTRPVAAPTHAPRPPTASSPPELAFTGSDAAKTLTLALALLIAGLAVQYALKPREH